MIPPILYWVAAVAAVLIVAGRLHYLFWVRRLSVPAAYAEKHELRTKDGARITLHRLPPPKTPERAPVLLVHGVAANHRNVDAEPDRSLARTLSARGRDVWLLTLRCGHPSLSRRERRLARFAAMAEHDLPAAIAFVLERTRAERVDYVGFSMGGMLLYAALGRTVEPARLGRAALVGSPGRVVLPFRFLRAFRRMPTWLLPALWLRLLGRMAAFVIEPLRTPLHRLVYNPDNVEPGAAARALVNLIEDVPAPLNADFARFALDDGVILVNGADVLIGIGTVRVPAIFFAGAADRLAPVDAVRIAHDAWGFAHDDVEKRFVVLGRTSGCAHDYGHGDLAVGRDLPRDLFEPLAEFLG